MDAATNAPLRRAQVLLASGPLGVRRVTTTDGNGRYEFLQVAEGRYNVTASKGSYVTLQYGQRRAFEPGRPVALADGQDLSQVDFSLPRGSVIAGRITDEFGEAIAGAYIEVQRYQFGPNGQRQLTFGGTGLVLTNDLGEFRAYGLMPGEYVVSAVLRQPSFQQGTNPSDVTEGYAPTYYPGTVNPAEADLVNVALAQEATIHLALQAGRRARVSGTVVDSAGQSLAGVRVFVRNAPGSGSTITVSSSGAAGADGSFTIANVPPGQLYLDVAREGRGDAPPEMASVPLTMTEQDITNLRIVTGPAATVSGVVVFEGDSPRRGVLSGLSVTTRPLVDTGPGPTFGFVDAGRVDDNNRFQLRGMGQVFFRAINLGPWTLKRVSLNGQDLTDTPYELRPSESIEGLRVVLTDRITEVTGGVIDPRGQPSKDFVVVVQPASDVDASRLQRFLQTARPDQDGRFRLRALPPGDYVATAIEALEQGREWDPEYRPRLREVGRRFSLREGDSQELDLTLVPGL